MLPILIGALAAIALQFLLEGLALVLSPEVGAALTCASCCASPMLLGFIPAFVGIIRDPGLQPGEGFALSFIGIGAGSLVLLGVIYMGTSIEEMRDQGEEIMRGSLEVMADNPDFSMSEEEQANLLEASRTIFPYVPLGVAMVTSLLSGLFGLISVLILRGRSRPQSPTMSA
jgi:hypothetical protein